MASQREFHMRKTQIHTVVNYGQPISEATNLLSHNDTSPTKDTKTLTD